MGTSIEGMTIMMPGRSLCLLLLSPALAFAQAPQRAGEVSLLLPRAQFERGSTAAVDAKLNDPVFWRDWFETQLQARARLALLDGSHLNVGSGARLQVLAHDQTTERTELELQFGKMRARVQKRSPQGRFEVRTNAAVVGVIGTHVYVGAATALTTVINFEGEVQVANADPAVAGEQTLSPFELAEVEPGQPPRKRLATLAELLRALEDTLPGPQAKLSPQQARAGQCIAATSSQPVVGSANATALPLELTPRGCAGPDITPLRLCVPPETKPGVYEYPLQGSDGTPRWAAFGVAPPAPLQDAWLVFLPELPLGATHTARLVGTGDAPLAGVLVRIRQGGAETSVETDEAGGFTVTAEAPGPIELEVSRGGGALPHSPFGELEPLRASIQVVDKIKEKPTVPAYSQRGTLVTLGEDVQSARVGDQAVPVVRTVTRSGRTLSSLVVPRDLPEGGQSLDTVDSAGKQRRRPLGVYEVLAGRLDQHALTSGAVTQGEFLVCVGADGGGEKVHARIVAVGPVRFQGRGAKGKQFEQTFAAETSGLLRIPFQIQAEKGAPGVGIPFTLTLFLEND